MARANVRCQVHLRSSTGAKPCTSRSWRRQTVYACPIMTSKMVKAHACWRADFMAPCIPSRETTTTISCSITTISAMAVFVIYKTSCAPRTRSHETAYVDSTPWVGLLRLHRHGLLSKPGWQTRSTNGPLLLSVKALSLRVWCIASVILRIDVEKRRCLRVLACQTRFVDIFRFNMFPFLASTHVQIDTWCVVPMHVQLATWSLNCSRCGFWYGAKFWRAKCNTTLGLVAFAKQSNFASFNRRNALPRHFTQHSVFVCRRPRCFRFRLAQSHTKGFPNKQKQPIPSCSLCTRTVSRSVRCTLRPDDWQQADKTLQAHHFFNDIDQINRT